ncbi:MAG: hypothetical protein FWB83_10975, partial [Treponema sp.]|nr:hypothetical protein [Treponema sp.]
MKTRAIALRILQQMRHDKRTLALMFVAPIIVLTLIYFVLDETHMEGHVAIISAPDNYINALADYNIITSHYDERDARTAIETGEIDASIRVINGKSFIEIDGSNPDKARM